MRAPSQAALFPTLMVASALTAFILPAGWTSWLRTLFQPLALLQMPVSAAGRGLVSRLESTDGVTVTREQAGALLRENEALQRQVLHQQGRVAALEQQLETASAIAAQGGESHVRIVIAPVVQYEASATQATLRVALTEQQAQHVLPGQWVLAPAAAPPESNDQSTVTDLRDRAWVVGRVNEVRSRTAAVQLTTDPRFRTEVYAARPRSNGGWQLAPESCLLVGQGRSRMRLTAGTKCPECGAARGYAERMAITQALRDYAREGFEFVVVGAARTNAVPLVLGRLVAAQTRDDSPQHFDLTVEPFGRADRLPFVYIQCAQ